MLAYMSSYSLEWSRVKKAIWKISFNMFLVIALQSNDAVQSKTSEHEILQGYFIVSVDRWTMLTSRIYLPLITHSSCFFLKLHLIGEHYSI